MIPRIKKEKKDTVRKIKTERISKKDGTSRASEPSTSKKKRKSREIVEVNSKKKKKNSDNKPGNIPSSSRDAKVPVTKKKKDKKEEKKKDPSKKIEEAEIVVLDDDSDKEEKRGQKSLLDLLELEMRARAIRSLLKKEEAVQAQKILSEYKDEPDDLIPIDIEPPQIELLSDSEGEETANAIDLEAHENVSTGKLNEGISSKQPEDTLQSFEDREQYSRSPPCEPNNDFNSVSCAKEKTPASDSLNSEILNKNTSKSTNGIEGQAAKSDLSDPSHVLKNCEKNDETKTSVGSDHDTIQSSVSGDIISVEASEVPGSSGSASQCSSASKQYSISCDPTGKSVGSDCTEQNASKIDSSQRPEKSQCISSSPEDSRNENDTGHFLVIEEPSSVQVTDGSQIEESIIEANNSCIEIIEPSSNLDSDRDQITCLVENVDCLTVQEAFQQPAVAECTQIDSECGIGNEENAFDNSDPSFIESSPEEDANCDIHVEGDSGCSDTPGANLRLYTLADGHLSSFVEDDSHSQFEDEVLDYDYNPVNIYCEKESDVSVSAIENSPRFVADEAEGNGIGNYHISSVLYPSCNDDKKSEETQNNLEDGAHHVSSECEIFVPETTDWPENSNPNLIHPSDLPLKETTSNTYSLAENVGDRALEIDLHRQSPSKVDILPRNKLETIVNPLSKAETDTECTSEIYTHEKESHSCLNIEPPVDVEIEEQGGSPEQNRMTTKQDIIKQLPGFDTGSSENIATINTVSDDLLLLEESISDVGKDGTPQNSSGCVAASGYTADLVQQTSITEQDGKNVISELCLPFGSGYNTDVIIPTVASKQTIEIHVNCNLSSNKSDEIIQEGQNPECTSLASSSASCTVKSSNSIPSQILGSGYVADLIQQTSIINSEQDGKNMLSEPCLPFRSDDYSDVIIPTVASKQKIEIPVDCNSISSKNDEIIQEGQNPECTSLAGSSASCTVKSSNSILEPVVISEEFEILDVENESQVPSTSGTDASTLASDETRHPYSQDLIADVAEIIGITEQEPVDSSEVVFVSEERVNSDSIDDSDNEISDKAAFILERMSNILNDDECRAGERGQASPQANSVVPAKVFAVNSSSSSSNSSSDRATDEENEDDGLPDDHSVVEISDVDDASEETKDEETSDTNGSESSLDRGSIEIIDDSDSVCSVESQRDDSKSDDCVMVLQPQVSISDDCIIVTEPDISKNSNVVLTEPEGSECNDCAIISLHKDALLDECVHISEEEVPCGKATSSSSSEKPFTPTDKDSVRVTIIIEDDEGEEEEVQLLTEDVPAEILELDDGDEAKTNWTARWLESDNVKKVVQTSKILTNVRKQMKMKLKKIEVPITNDLELPEEKSAPPLIGSVEEYHRLVKEGVIFSKATQNDEKTESSNISIKDGVGPAKVSTDTVSAETKAQEGHEKKSDKEKTGKKKKLDRNERQKKLEKSKKKRRKSDKHEKKKSDKFSLYPSKVPELSPSPGAMETDLTQQTKSTLDVPDVRKVVVEDSVREDGEIIESQSEVPDCVDNPKAGNKTHGKITDIMFDDRVFHREQRSGKEGDKEEREEGETSEKEEGEISDSDCDGRESQKSSQPEVSSALERSLGGSTPLSSIPLPQNPPTKQLTTRQDTNHPKQQSYKTPTKTPGRNSAAKRFILRNLQLGRKNPARSKNKKKKKKGEGRGNKKGLGYSPNAAPEKNKRSSKSQMEGTYKKPVSQTEVNSMASTSDSLQTVPGIQPSYLASYSGLSQPGSMSQLGSAQNTTVNVSSTAQTYDSYYSWAYSQGLINSASGNYGYGTTESTPDPNVYKQWEEYYRKLMEACKVSAEHASAGSLYNFASASTTEKSGYTWVFEHSSGAAQTSKVEQTSADSTTEPVMQAQAPGISSETNEVSQSVVPITNEMSDKDRFESWQYRYGLKGLLKEHFIPDPTAPSTGDGSQNS